MSETTITQLPDPSGFISDPFTDVLRDGARKLIEQAIHAELTALMNAFSGDKLEDERTRLVRHGHLPEREVMTGIGPVQVKVPRVRDRKPGADKITFPPSIDSHAPGHFFREAPVRRGMKRSILLRFGDREHGGQRMERKRPDGLADHG